MKKKPFPLNRRFEFGNRVIELKVSDQSGEPAEVMLYDSIGKDPWEGGGISSKDFKSVLDAIPRDRDINLRINSKGGDVHEGMCMRNLLDSWPKNLRTTIDGIAASTASWVSPARATVCAYKNSQLFIHDAIAFGFGNSADLRKTADDLDKTSDQIAGMYAEKTGKGARTMRAMMKDETLMTGEEAEELGLVDELIDGTAVRNFAQEEISQMKSQIALFNSVASGSGAAAAKQPTQIMNKEQIIALLKENGVTVTNEMTDEQLQAALKQLLNNKKENAEPLNTKPLEAELAKTKLELEKISNAMNAAERIRITNEVQQIVNDDKLTAAEQPKALERAIKDPTYLDELKSRPAKPPGAAPLSASRVECTSDSFTDVQNFVLDNGPRFMDRFIYRNTGNVRMTEEIRRDISARAISVANTIDKNRKTIIQAWNTNAIDAALQRQVILQDMLEAYAIPLINLNVFSTVYNTIPLEGTDKVEVPYFPLQTTASTSFTAGTGYTTASDWTQNSREIPVGGDGASGTSGSNAAANTARDRKYQMISFYSYDLRRQPYLMLTKLFQQAANKLGVDVFTDIVARTVTTASFGASAKVATSGFSADDVADLRETVTGLGWPTMGRSLVLDHRIYTPLLKDPSFKQYLAYGSSDPIQQGRISNAYGFDNIVELANLTNYAKAGENMNGFVTHKSAVLVATSPIMPTEEVRNLLTRYDVVVDPKTGIAFEYRRFADAVKDQTLETIESSYGAGKGVDNALRRLTSA